MVKWLDTTLCDKGGLWLAASQWFSPGAHNSSNNKADRHDIAEILLKVATLWKWPSNDHLFQSYGLVVSADALDIFCAWSSVNSLISYKWFFKDLFSLETSQQGFDAQYFLHGETKSTKIV
jgi:hypothetical protein